MSPEQCRAARAWLNWSMDDLATRAHVSNSTIRDFEAGRRTPIQNNLEAIRRSMEVEGIVFSGAVDGTLSVAGKAREPQSRAQEVEEMVKTVAPRRKRKSGTAKRRG
jgi:transcriptional regulator with XRE-family HTH domain